MECLICGKESKETIKLGTKIYQECKECKAGIFAVKIETIEKIESKIMRLKRIEESLKELISMHILARESLDENINSKQQWGDAIYRAEEVLK